MVRYMIKPFKIISVKIDGEIKRVKYELSVRLRDVKGTSTFTEQTEIDLPLDEDEDLVVYTIGKEKGWIR